MLPTVNFLGGEVSRLTMGDNPTNGYSYIPDLTSREEMLSYYTEEKVIEQLFEAERLGYTVWQPLASEFILRVLWHYREQGGRLKLIFQTHVPVDFEVNLRQILPYKPIACYHQGTSADGMFEEGKKDILRDRIKLMQSLGLKSGFATHVPEHIMIAEDEGWGCDFYMACLQNTRKRGGERSTSVTGKTRKDVEFYPEDRPIMLKTIAQVPTPCIAYKVLAGGQIFLGKEKSEYPALIEAAYRETFAAIKPCDLVTVGVFQKHGNQLRENAEIVSRVLSSLNTK